MTITPVTTGAIARPNVAAAPANPPAPPFNECPAVSYDTSCQVLINYTDAQTQILDDSSQGPFDGSDDTLIGIVNNSTATLKAIDLASDQQIFGFEVPGDGICSGYDPGPTGCPFDDTGYAGPGVTYSGINAEQTGGIVNFTGGLAPGGVAYFGLEEPLDASTVFSGGPSKASEAGAPPQFQKSTVCYAKLPVNCATGSFIHQFTDLTVPGRGISLNLARTYSSANAASDGPFGHGWTGSYDLTLSLDTTNNTATLTDDTGAPVTFTNSGGTWAAPPWVQAQFADNGDGTFTVTKDPSQQRYTFDSAGRLISETDRNGYATTVSYDAAGHISAVTDSTGRTLTFTWTGDHVASVADPLGRTWHYTYDSSGDLTAATDPAGNASSFTYDSNHQLLTMTTPDGGVVTNVYDGSGRVTSQTDAAGLTTTWGYSGDPGSADGSTTAMTDEHGSQTLYVYANMELQSVTHAAGTAAAATTSYTYDPATLGRATITDPLGNVTSYSYDNYGETLSSTDPLARTTSWSYDSYGNVTEIAYPAGETVSYSYDGQGNLLDAYDALGDQTDYAHSDSAHPEDVTEKTDPDGRITDYTYDSTGDLLSATTHPSDRVSLTTDYGYNADGEQLCAASPATVAAGTSCAPTGTPRTAGTVRTSYDADGRISSVLDADGARTSYGYDPDGNKTSVTDPIGRVTSTRYDLDDRRTSRTTGSGSSSAATTRWAYDLAAGTAPCTGVPTASWCSTTTDPNGHATVTFYNGRGDQVAQTRPGGLTTVSTLDAAGNTTSTTLPDGTVVTRTVDADHELTAVTHPSGTPNVSFTYDADGRRATMTDGTGTTSYSYNADGRLTDVTDGTGQHTGYSWDPAGDLTALIYPDGNTVTRAFDGADRMASVTDWLGNTTTFSYDADGNPTGTDYGNGDTATSAFDAADRLTSTVLSSGSTTLLGLAYTRDATGNLTGETATGQQQSVTSYSYDPSQRLTTAGAASYGYDAGGNPTQLAGTTQTFSSSDELTSASNTSTSTTYTYDGNGERTTATSTAGTATSYGYNHAGQLASAVTTSTAPTVTALSPASGPLTGGTTITITGSHFGLHPTVTVGANTATAVTVVTATTLHAVVPAATAGATVDVRVHNGSLLSATSTADRFTYLARPTITHITPPAGPLAGSTSVTVTGTGFVGVTAVHFGSRTGTFKVASPTTLTATAPAGTGGAVDITATTPLGTSATATADRFTYTSAPVIYNMSATAGTPTGGNHLTITGGNFTGVTKVLFGTTSASFTKTATTLTVTVPAHASGAVTVTVQATSGSAHSAYTYLNKPAVTSVSPAAGPALGGATVTLTGTGFSQVSAVRFGGVAAAFTVSATTRITARPPAHASGSVAVQVTTPGGVSTAVNYTYSASILPAGHSAYTYNGDGLRISATTAATVRTFSYDLTGTVPAILSDGQYDFVTGPLDTPVEQISTAGAVSYYFADALGSTRAITDSTGAVVLSRSYGAYGAVASTTGTAAAPFGFASGYTDQGTGLLYLINRYYDPASAAFLTVDPVAAESGSAYRYTEDDPVNRADPLGLFWSKTTWEEIGVGLGVVALAATGVGIAVDLGASVAIGGVAISGTTATAVSLTAGLGATALDIEPCRQKPHDKLACAGLLMGGLSLGYGLLSAGLDAASVWGYVSEDTAAMGKAAFDVQSGLLGATGTLLDVLGLSKGSAKTDTEFRPLPRC